MHESVRASRAGRAARRGTCDSSDRACWRSWAQLLVVEVMAGSVEVFVEAQAAM